MLKTAGKIKEIPPVLPEKVAVSLPDRNAEIAQIAYFKAEKRGFAPGHAMDDWLEAEQEFDMQKK
jgi:hypothetical protein